MRAPLVTLKWGKPETHCMELKARITKQTNKQTNKINKNITKKLQQNQKTTQEHNLTATARDLGTDPSG
jgi:hypothetical protein